MIPGTPRRDPIRLFTGKTISTGKREDNSSGRYTREGVLYAIFATLKKRGCRRENTQGGDPVRDRGARPAIQRPFTHKAITAAVLRSRSPERAGKNRRHRPRPYKHTRTKSDAENLRSYTAPAEKNQSQIENHNNGGKTVLNRFKPPRA